jgi:hypothetical protein
MVFSIYSANCAAHTNPEKNGNVKVSRNGQLHISFVPFGTLTTTKIIIPLCIKIGIVIAKNINKIIMLNPTMQLRHNESILKIIFLSFWLKN